MLIHNGRNQCDRFTDIPRSGLALTVNIRWSQWGEQRLCYVKCQYKVLNFKPRLLASRARAKNLSLRLCEFALSVAKIVLTLISGNVKYVATRRCTRQPPIVAAKRMAAICDFQKRNFGTKEKPGFPKELCSRPNITTPSRFTALVVHKSECEAGYIHRRGASRFKIHVDGLKGISAFCRNQSDCK